MCPMCVGRGKQLKCHKMMREESQMQWPHLVVRCGDRIWREVPRHHDGRIEAQEVPHNGYSV